MTEEKNPAVSPIRDDRVGAKGTVLEWIRGGFVFPGKIAPPDETQSPRKLAEKRKKT